MTKQDKIDFLERELQEHRKTISELLMALKRALAGVMDPEARIIAKAAIRKATGEI